MIQITDVQGRTYRKSAMYNLRPIKNFFCADTNFILSMSFHLLSIIKRIAKGVFMIVKKVIVNKKQDNWESF